VRQLRLLALKGGLTPVERNLLEHGDQHLVRRVRLRYQENNRDAFQGAVERLTGRRVLAYYSQVLFDPDYMFEIFVLGDELVSPNAPPAPAPEAPSKE